MTRWKLNPTLSIRLGTGNITELAYVHAGRWQVGELPRPELGKWLFALAAPKTLANMEALAVDELGVCEEEARELVSDLVKQGAIIELDAAGTRSAELWIERGWRDALDFHLSTRDTEFLTGDVEGKEEERAIIQAFQAEKSEPLEPTYKDYPEAARIELPRGSRRIDAASFGETIHRRRTCRAFTGEHIGFDELGELIEHAFGKVREVKSPIGPYIARTSPSGGMLHPTEVYVVAHRVKGLAPGLYHYSVRHHALSTLALGDFADQVEDIGHRQSGLRKTAASFFFTTRWQRHIWKYRYSRSYRSAVYDVAHLVQTQLFIATALGMRSFLTPAIRDTEALRLLRLDDYLAESPMYLTAVGR